MYTLLVPLWMVSENLTRRKMTTMCSRILPIEQHPKKRIENLNKEMTIVARAGIIHRTSLVWQIRPENRETSLPVRSKANIHLPKRSLVKHHQCSLPFHWCQFQQRLVSAVTVSNRNRIIEPLRQSIEGKYLIFSTNPKTIEVAHNLSCSICSSSSHHWNVTEGGR